MSVRVAADSPTLPRRKLGRPGIHNRQEIIDAACDLFVRQSYYGTTMQHIADAVGVTKGGIYHYIQSKEDVLYTIHNDFITEGIQRMELAVSSNDTPLDQLRRVIEAQVSLMHDFHREINLVVQEMHHLSGAKREAFVLRRNEYESIVIRVIRDCVDAGVIRSKEPDTIARFILGAINWMYLWYQPNGRLSPQDLSALVGDMVIHGLADGCSAGLR